jgi:hypothetical protein
MKGDAQIAKRQAAADAETMKAKLERSGDSAAGASTRPPAA